MVKRAVSKRWAVEPGYEPPLTRLKVKGNPSLAPPRTQDVPLPTRTRRPRGAAAPAAKPPMRNAEEMDQGDTANDAQSGELIMEIETDNHVEEAATGNQSEETTEGNQLENITMENQILAAGNQTENHVITVSQLAVILEEQNRQSVTDEEQRELDPENPTEVNIALGQIGDMTHGGQNETEVPDGNAESTAAEMQMDEMIDESQIEADPTTYQFLYTPEWTQEDQSKLEEEIRIASGKPKNERSYSWNLIVGMSGVSQAGPTAPDPMLVGAADLENVKSQAVKEPATNRGIALTKEATSTAAEKPSVASVSVAPAESHDKPDTTDESEIKYITPSKWMTAEERAKRKATSAQAEKNDTSNGPPKDKSIYTQSIYRSRQVSLFNPEESEAEMKRIKSSGMISISSGTSESDLKHMTPTKWMSAEERKRKATSAPAELNADPKGPPQDKSVFTEAIHRSRQVSLFNPEATIQKQTIPVPASPQVVPPQQVEQLPPQPMAANNGGAGANEPQAAAADAPPPADAPPSVFDALQRNAMRLGTERVLRKLDVITDRRFRQDPLFQRLNVPNTDLQFTVVSYSIMAELETEDEEARASGCLGAARIGIGLGSADDATEKDTYIRRDNYCDRIRQELDFLKSDILCIQSIAEWYWAKLERMLNNFGYHGYKMNRRPGPGSYCEAIFFRTKRFMLISRDATFLDELITEQSNVQPSVIYVRGICESVKSREVVVMMTLRCKQSGCKFRVVNMRCVPEHKDRPDLQAIQVCSVLQRLEELNAQPDGRMPSILCGNMDFQPDDQGPYQLVRDGFLGDATSQCFNSIDSTPASLGQKCPLATAYKVGFQHSMSKLKSAYDKVLGSEPPTVWKRASNTFVCGSYVWFDEAELSVVGVLDMVNSNAVTDSGIPNDELPSGSLSLKARFQFKEAGIPPTAGVA